MNTASHIFALLLASIATATSAAPPAPDTRDQAIALIASSYEYNIGYQIIESLTTEVGARQAGSEAEARARRWGADKFRQLGFSNVRIEPFEVEFWQRASERAEIVAPFPQNLAITSLGGSVGTSDDGVRGDVVRFATLQALKDAPRTGLEGKIVFDKKVVFEGEVKVVNESSSSKTLKAGTYKDTTVTL